MEITASLTACQLWPYKLVIQYITDDYLHISRTSYIGKTSRVDSAGRPSCSVSLLDFLLAFCCRQICLQIVLSVIVFRFAFEIHKRGKLIFYDLERWNLNGVVENANCQQSTALSRLDNYSQDLKNFKFNTESVQAKVNKLN